MSLNLTAPADKTRKPAPIIMRRVVNSFTVARPRTLTEPVGALDARFRAARDIARLREALTAHCGGNPSAVQQALIELVCQLRLRLMVTDQRFAESGRMARDNEYLALVNTYSRALTRLGLKAALESGQSLSDYIQNGTQRAETAPRHGPPRRNKPAASVRPLRVRKRPITATADDDE